MSEVLGIKEIPFQYIPDSLLLKIFSYLSAEDLCRVLCVCKYWNSIGHDDFLWKDLTVHDYQIDLSIGLPPGKFSWKDEYKRLYYHTPVLETEVLREHSHQVLHVSFSHDGKMFATSSKDGYILVWDSGYTAKIKYKTDMKTFSWKYTQFSQFNESDTLLLVSGVHLGSQSTSGEIAVFSLEGDFQLQCRMTNKPYDIFGTWYNEQYFISGELRWLANLVSSSDLLLNKASQEIYSEHEAIINKFFKFYNKNASSIRTIMVANCVGSEEEIEVKDKASKCYSSGSTTVLERGNPVSHKELSSTRRDSRSLFCEGSRKQSDGNCSSGPSSVMYMPTSCSNSSTVFHSKTGDKSSRSDSFITYSEDYRAAERESSENWGASKSRNLVSVGFKSETCVCDKGCGEVLEDDCNMFPNTCGSQDAFISMDIDEESSEDELSEEVKFIDTREKYLIFSTGSKTYTPHEIGFKRIKPFAFVEVIDAGLSLRDRIALKRERENNPPLRNSPDWMNYDAVADRFDKVDHLIDLHGHIIGMGLSPDHRYLYVNSRPWPQGCVIDGPLNPPPIAQEIDIHVIDLLTLKEVGKMLRSHKAYTPNDECFFIFLDVCNEYVASGAEDKHGYLWDRHYGICLSKFPHTDVVNSVAFNPTDSEMLITASDDFTLKIWRSKNRAHELNISPTKSARICNYRQKTS